MVLKIKLFSNIELEIAVSFLLFRTELNLQDVELDNDTVLDWILKVVF